MAISFFNNKNNKSDRQIQKVALTEIKPNQYQPRTNFDIARLDQLAQTIDQHGLLQPITLRKSPDADQYEIIAGERRYRAAGLLGWTEIDAIVVDMSNEESAALALIENLQREELSVIEEAKSYQELLQVMNLTQSELAQKLGKSQSFIANKLRLLKLKPEIIDAIDNNEITERHARALMKLPEDRQVDYLDIILADDLNVAQTDTLIKDETQPKATKQQRKTKTKLTNKKTVRNPILAVNTIKKSIKLVEEAGYKVDYQVFDDPTNDGKTQIIINLE